MEPLPSEQKQNNSDIESVTIDIKKNTDIFADQKKLKTEDLKINEEKPSPIDTTETNDYSNKQKIIGIVLKTLIILGLISFGVLQTQLSDKFSLLGGSFAQKKILVESEALSKQSQINIYNLEIAAGKLDNFTYLAETYLANAKKESNKPHTKSEELKLSMKEIKDTLKKVNKEEPALTNTKNLLNTQKSELASKLSTQSDKEATKTEIQNINNILSLISDASISTKINVFDIEKASNEEIQEFLDSLYGKQKNHKGIINTLNKNKILWSDILAEIDLITKGVDPLYGSALSQDIGQISYSNFELQSLEQDKENKIIVAGEIKTPNSVNFIITSDLIDALEKSALFKDVSMRSFSKKVTNEGNIEGDFNIQFSLEAI